MSSSQTLIDRSEAAQKELKKLRRRFQLGSWITGIVGAVIIVVLAGYFCYGYIKISELKDPELIVALVGQLVDDQIPQVRRRLESEVDNNAAVWAQQASEEVLKVAPTLRKEIEELAIEQADKAIDQLNVMGEKEFQRLLDENRDTVKQALQDLEDNNEISEGVLLLLEENLAKELQMDVEALAQTPLVIVSDLNKSGKSLLKGENLSEEQEHERRVLMVVRRLQNVQFPNLKLEGITVPSEVSDSIEQLEHARLDKQKQAVAATAKKAAEASKEEAAKPAKPEADKASSKEAAKPVAKEAAQAKDDNAAKPEAEAKKTDQPEKAQSDAPSDEKKVAEAKPADK